MLQGPGQRVGRADAEFERALTVRQVAERLGVSTATVYELVRRGEIASVRVLSALRVTEAALRAFVRASDQTRA